MEGKRRRNSERDEEKCEKGKLGDRETEERGVVRKTGRQKEEEEIARGERERL